MVRKVVVVEVCHAHNLMPKDGQGSSSPFVEVDFDSQRQRTKTKTKQLNPVWNEKLVFHVNDPSAFQNEALEVNIYNDKKTSLRNFLGRVRIPGSAIVRQGEDAVIPYTLEKRGLFSHIKGEIFLRVYYTDDYGGGGSVKQGGKGNREVLKNGNHNNHDGDLHLSQQQSYLQVEPRKGEAASVQVKKMEQNHNSISGSRSMVSAASNSPSLDYALRETAPHLGSNSTHGEKSRTTYDLVEKMEYLYVKIVKARGLGGSEPSVQIKVGNQTTRTSKAASGGANPEWNQVFAFSKDKFQAPSLELTVKDREEFLGQVGFEISEIPTRVPPDSPLAPQWYKLEGKKKAETISAASAKNIGEVMLSVWIGTQADEAFPEAWQSDTGGFAHTRSKVYLSPKLWYVRVNVIEAQDLIPLDKLGRFPDPSVKVQLGFQISKTRSASHRNNGSSGNSSSPFWNEDLVFVAAEPFEDALIVTVEDRVGPNKEEVIGTVHISLSGIERRVDHRQVTSRWFNLDSKRGGGGEKKDNNASTGKFSSRIHLRVCLDGGYHVLDESTHHSSDLRPTAKQLWKAPIGVLEMGILGASGLLPMKNKNGRGSTDAYCVAKYGQKWVRTRTLVDNFNPKWNEQYTWEVYDPCTVLTVGVFDNCHLLQGSGEKAGGGRDSRIGKVRIRLSTLEADRVYTHSYPLLALHTTGVKKMGEVELAVRFSCFSVMNMIGCYTRPLLPKMHYLHPLGVAQLEHLRASAMRIAALRLSRAEPPLRLEVVQYMLDVDSNMWSMRKSKANWFRLRSVLSGALAIGKWSNDICQWKNPITTVLVHMLYLILVWYPELILPTLFLYMFLVGAWKYRFRPRHPPHMDPRLSHAEAAESDELDEEFDSIPTSKGQDIVKSRYDRLRVVAGRIQTVLGDLATQGERLQALLGWRDPRATAIFIAFCLVAAVVLYVTPFRVIAIVYGLYALRHPRFQTRMPSLQMNFFRRLPALSDRML